MTGFGASDPAEKLYEHFNIRKGGSEGSLEATPRAREDNR
jgi:hypothetical protein